MYWLFEFPCQVTGFVCRSEQVKNLFSAIEQLNEGQNYLSSSVSRFLNLAVLKQQEQLLNRKLRNPLTKMELSILREISKGKKSQQIADDFFRSVHTINNHRKNIARKLSLEKKLKILKFCAENSEAIQTFIALKEHKNTLNQLVEK